MIICISELSHLGYATEADVAMTCKKYSTRHDITYKHPLELGWIQPRKKEGHRDIIAHTILLYVHWES